MLRGHVTLYHDSELVQLANPHSNEYTSACQNVFRFDGGLRIRSVGKASDFNVFSRAGNASLTWITLEASESINIDACDVLAGCFVFEGELTARSERINANSFVVLIEGEQTLAASKRSVLLKWTAPK